MGDNRYALRRNIQPITSQYKEISWVRCDYNPKAVKWCSYQDKYLKGYATTPGTPAKKFRFLEEAKRECLKPNSYCNGITQEPNNDHLFTLRNDYELKPSSRHEMSWKTC